MNYVENKLKSQKSISILRKITKLSWINFIQVLQTYFIVSIERKLSGYGTDNLFVTYELKKELFEDHINEYIKPLIEENELELLMFKQDEFKESKYKIGRSKLKDFINQLSQILIFKHKLYVNMIPQGKYLFEYIQELILYGSLASLLDFQIIPNDGQVKQPIKESSDKMIIELLNAILEKLNKEDLSYNDAKIKELIEIQNEKERRVFATSYDKLTNDERLIAMLQRQIGLGDYAIGDKIHKYDEEVWNVLQKQRKHMENDIPDFGDLEEFNPYADGEYGEANGYDVAQQMDDDF